MARLRKLAREQLGDHGAAQAAARAAESGPAAFSAYLGVLYEAQDFEAFQAQARRFNELIGAGSFSELTNPDAKYALWCSEAAALPVPEVSALVEKLRALVPVRGAVSRVVEAAEFRLRYRRSAARQFTGKATLIALGLHCLPWKLLNRWGLRQSENFFRTYNPFALSRHKYDALVTDLAADFVDYVPTGQLSSTTSLQAKTVHFRRDRGAVWTHHLGEYWARDGFAALRRDLEEKLDNFRRSARLPDPVFIMAMTPFNFPAEPIERLDEIHAALTRLTGERPYHLLMTNSYITEHGTRSFEVDDRTAYMYAPYPEKDYIWNAIDIRDSPVGLRFEEQYAREVRDNLIRWKLVAPRAVAPATGSEDSGVRAEAAE